MSYQIYFINQNKRITVDGGKLSAACELAGFPLNLVCGGNGACGKCRVRIKGKADEKALKKFLPARQRLQRIWRFV